MAGVSSVVIKIGAETASAVAAIKEVDGSLQKTQTTGQKMQAGIQKAALPAAAALTALTAAGVASAKAAADDAASRQQLDSQLQRSLGASKEVTAANEERINWMSDATAVSREELRPELAQAVRATGDLTKAHSLLKTALDVSAATGKPLSAVTAALGKAYNGSTGSLKRLVPSISAAALASGKWAPIQKELNAQVGGTAKGHAETAAGQYAKMQNAMHELQVEIGTALLPVMAAFLPVVIEVLGVFSGHSDVIVAVAGAVAAFAAAILVANAAIKIYEGYQIAVSAATKIWSAAQWLLNAALDANPIGLAIIAVAALTAGIILAYKHSATFRNIVQSAFAVAKQNAVLLLGPLGLIIRAFQLLYQNSGTFRQIVAAALHAVADAAGLVLRAFQKLVSSGKSVGDALTRAFNAVVDAINGLISIVENLVRDIGKIHFPSKPSWVPFSVPGGFAATPMAAGSGGPVINVNITGAIDPEASALAIRRVLTRYDRRRGQSPLGGGLTRA